MTKAEIRRSIKERLKHVDRAGESAAILSLLEPLIPAIGLVLAFEPFRDEPDISPLINSLRAANRLALIIGRGNEARVEPAGEIALALVPGRAFDRAGGRLGRGGGTFDRILASLECSSVGVCFDCQLVDALPVEDHDVRMTRVVTAQGVLEVR